MSSSAARVRRYRERSRDGRAIFRLELDEVEVEALLAAAGLLPAEGTDDRAAVEAALEQLISLLILDSNALHPDM